MKLPDNQINRPISFNYRGRKVKCIVKAIHQQGFTGTLQTDYIGKNVNWYKGEDKFFVLSTCEGMTFHN